jgi:uncharacterized protein YqgQ
MTRDLTYINKLLLRYGIYVYDKDMGNMLTLMEMEIKELYSHVLISKEEYIEAFLILKRRKEG